MTDRISAADYRKTKVAPKNKFNAQRVTVDGITYDSKAEARYGAELRIRERAGEVSSVELQKPYPLIAGSGEVVGIYKADFAFFDHIQDRQRVIDVKGHDTPLSRHKRKHVRAQYGVEVEIVR